jgi:hypothetical protein
MPEVKESGVPWNPGAEKKAAKGKVKIFTAIPNTQGWSGGSGEGKPDGLETKINDFIQREADEVLHVLQSSIGEQLVITIFYK